MSVGEDLGQRLRRARLDAGLSQNALAALCGVPKSRLSRYENGHLLPSLATLDRLAAGVNVSPAVLMGSRDPMDAFVAELTDLGVRFATDGEARAAARDVARVLGRRATA